MSRKVDVARGVQAWLKMYGYNMAHVVMFRVIESSHVTYRLNIRGASVTCIPAVRALCFVRELGDVHIRVITEKGTQKRGRFPLKYEGDQYEK